MKTFIVNNKNLCYVLLLFNLSWFVVFILFYFYKEIDIRFLLFFNWLFNNVILHLYLTYHKKEFISNKNELQLFVIIIYFVNTFLVYFISSHLDITFLIFWIIFSCLCYINYKLRNWKYRLFLYLPGVAMYEYLLYSKLNIFFIVNCVFTLIGILIFCYVKYKKINFFTENWYIKDNKIINDHLKYDFTYFNSISECFFFIMLFMCVISDTPLFTKFGSIIFYFVALLTYIRFFIVLYCNPVTKFPLTQYLQLGLTVSGLSFGGIFWTRDSILNSENPVNIPFFTERVQNKHWGYCAINKSAIIAEREYLSKFPLRPMPTKDVSTIFGTWKHVDPEAISRIIAAEEMIKALESQPKEIKKGAGWKFFKN